MAHPCPSICRDGGLARRLTAPAARGVPKRRRTVRRHTSQPPVSQIISVQRGSQNAGHISGSGRDIVAVGAQIRCSPRRRLTAKTDDNIEVGLRYVHKKSAGGVNSDGPKNRSAFGGLDVRRRPIRGCAPYQEPSVQLSVSARFSSRGRGALCRLYSSGGARRLPPAQSNRCRWRARATTAAP